MVYVLCKLRAQILLNNHGDFCFVGREKVQDDLILLQETLAVLVTVKLFYDLSLSALDLLPLCDGGVFDGLNEV